MFNITYRIEMKDNISDWSRLLNLSPIKIIIPLKNNKHTEYKRVIKFIYIYL